MSNIMLSVLSQLFAERQYVQVCKLASFILTLGEGARKVSENHRITVAARGGVEGSVRLLLTKNPACFFN